MIVMGYDVMTGGVGFYPPAFSMIPQYVNSQRFLRLEVVPSKQVLFGQHGFEATGHVGSPQSLRRWLCRIVDIMDADYTIRADASIAGQATGAMSFAFISALKKNPQQSYVQLLNSIRDELSNRYTQKPQLSCSHPLDVNLLYVM